MSSSENRSEIQAELPEDKQILLKKLSTIFDPATAIDFVCPKTFETRQHVTIEDLKQVNYDQPEERLQRLRLMEHYQATTQSLSGADLEASYQSFVRNQVGQQHSRDELEQFVRNSSDIDAAKRCLDSTSDILTALPQSQLLFHSSKLNQQRSNLLKSASSSRSLKQLHDDDLTVQKYFSQPLTTSPRSHHKQEENKGNYPRPRMMHMEHGEKKYRITFLKDSNALKFLHNSPHRSTLNRDLLLMEHRNIESLLRADTSTIHGRRSPSNTSNIHREIFPPLSLAALKEYRPTVTPKSSSSSSTTNTQQQRQKALQKKDFIWEQSIVSPKT